MADQDHRSPIAWSVFRRRGTSLAIFRNSDIAMLAISAQVSDSRLVVFRTPNRVLPLCVDNSDLAFAEKNMLHRFDVGASLVDRVIPGDRDVR